MRRPIKEKTLAVQNDAVDFQSLKVESCLRR